MLSKITASNLENCSYVKENFPVKNPANMINKFKEIISSNNNIDDLTKKNDIKQIITYTTAVLHINNDNSTSLDNDGLLEIADNLAQYINEKFSLSLSDPTNFFTQKDALELLNLCRHRNQGFEELIHGSSRYTRSVTQVLKNLGIDACTDGLKATKAILSGQSKSPCNFNLLGAIGCIDFKNLISDEKSITLIDYANYRCADFTNANNVTITSNADICGAIFDNNIPYKGMLDNHNSAVKSITNPELIVKFIKNNFRGNLAEFKLWIRTINSINSFDLDDSLDFENYNYNEVKVQIELLATLFEIAIKNQTAFRIQDYEEEFNLMLQIIKHPEQYNYYGDLIMSYALPNITTCTMLKNIFVSQKPPEKIWALANKINALINAGSSNKYDIHAKLLLITQYLTVACFKKLLPDEIDDELYEDIADSLNKLFNTQNASQNPNDKITLSDAEFLTKCCSHRNTFIDADKFRLTRSATNFLESLNLNITSIDPGDFLVIDEYIGGAHTDLGSFLSKFDPIVVVNTDQNNDVNSSDSENSYGNIFEFTDSDESESIQSINSNPAKTELSTMFEEPDNITDSSVIASVKINNQNNDISINKNPSIIPNERNNLESTATIQLPNIQKLVVVNKAKDSCDFILDISSCKNVQDMILVLTEILYKPNSMHIEAKHKFIRDTWIYALDANYKLDAVSFDIIATIFLEQSALNFKFNEDIVGFIFGKLSKIHEVALSTENDLSTQKLNIYKFQCILFHVSYKKEYPNRYLSKIFTIVTNFISKNNSFLATITDSFPNLVEQLTILTVIARVFHDHREYLLINKQFHVLDIAQSMENGTLTYSVIEYVRNEFNLFLGKKQEFVNTEIIFDIIGIITSEKGAICVLDILNSITEKELLRNDDKLS